MISSIIWETSGRLDDVNMICGWEGNDPPLVAVEVGFVMAPPVTVTAGLAVVEVVVVLVVVMVMVVVVVAVVVALVVDVGFPVIGGGGGGGGGGIVC